MFKKKLNILLFAMLFIAVSGLSGMYLLADDHEPYLTELPEWYNVNEEGKWVCSSQSISAWNPKEIGVRRVVAYIEHHLVTEDKTKVPDSLYLQNLKARLLNKLQHRYTTYGGRVEQTLTPGCYGRADQPISIYTNEDKANNSKFQQEILKPRTLGIVIRILVAPDSTEPFSDPNAFMIAVHKRWIRHDLQNSGEPYDTGLLSMIVYGLDDPNGDRDLKLFINRYF